MCIPPTTKLYNLVFTQRVFFPAPVSFVSVFLWRHITLEWRRSQLRCLVIRSVNKFWDYSLKDTYSVAQFIATLPYKWKAACSIPDGVVGIIYWLKSFQPHYGRGVNRASNRNEYQECLLECKVGQCVRLTTITTFMYRLYRCSGLLNFLQQLCLVQQSNWIFFASERYTAKKKNNCWAYLQYSEDMRQLRNAGLISNRKFKRYLT